MNRRTLLTKTKALSSPRMVFVEITFAKMAFVKSKNGLRRDYLCRYGLRQVQECFSSTTSSSKWPSSSPRMVFVEIIFAKMAFVKSKKGLRRDYLRQNGLRQVQEWFSSRLSLPKWPSSSLRMVFIEIIFANTVFVKSKNALLRQYLHRNGFRQVQSGPCRHSLR